MPPKKRTSSTISSSSGTMLKFLKKTEHNNTTPKPDTTASEVLSSGSASHQCASSNVSEPSNSMFRRKSLESTTVESCKSSPFVSAKIGDIHLLSPPGDPHQPRYKAYPVDKYNRHFRNTWYDMYKWLEWSEDANAVFCHQCRQAYNY